MRLGIYGGTFDPVHYGHLLLAESCREQLKLDAVWFVPAYVSPHKQGRDIVDANTRVEMLQLAIGGHEAFSVSRMPGFLKLGETCPNNPPTPGRASMLPSDERAAYSP